MRPSELSSRLRKIAQSLDNSQKPDLELVNYDLRRVLIAMQVDTAGAEADIDRAIVSLNQMYADMTADDFTSGYTMKNRDKPDVRAVYTMLEDLKAIKRKLHRVIFNTSDQ
jgi:hypothetical protein